MISSPSSDPSFSSSSALICHPSASCFPSFHCAALWSLPAVRPSSPSPHRLSSRQVLPPLIRHPEQYNIQPAYLCPSFFVNIFTPLVSETHIIHPQALLLRLRNAIHMNSACIVIVLPTAASLSNT
ncbi:hypothetical protein FKP32DRAFT_1434342 [Trametes sanguinea]|nr:hypothetical protein FKP32DRAFT_1434342 [Trametes sanguinea]